MLTTFLKTLGLTQASVDTSFHKRQINLSDNCISFAMPENFSRDFPAEDMVESVDLDHAAGISNYHGVTLLRRFWDFKSDGFFKKNIGTLVLLLYVKKIPDGCQKNLAHPLEFVEVLQKALCEHYEKSNKTTAEEYRFVYSDFFNTFGEYIFNQHRWIRYIRLREDGREGAAHYAIPITPSHYFVAEFISLPTNTIGMRNFTSTYTDEFIDKIVDTFDVAYAAGNHLVQGIQQCKNLRLEQLIEELTQTKDVRVTLCSPHCCNHSAWPVPPPNRCFTNARLICRAIKSPFPCRGISVATLWARIWLKRKISMMSPPRRATVAQNCCATPGILSPIVSSKNTLAPWGCC